MVCDICSHVPRCTVCFIELPGSWVMWIMFIILTCICLSNYLVTSDAVVCPIDK